MIGSDTENIELTPDVIRKTFEAIGYSSSIFTIQLLNEYLNLHEELFSNKELRESRINYPGLMSDSNWKLRMPFTLEKLKICGLHRTIKEINKKTERNGL